MSPDRVRSACLRCGNFRAGFREVCPACGHRPEGEGLLVAWLLSEHALTPEQLDRAAVRVREGEAIRPSRRMLDRARRALGAHFASDPGLDTGQRLLLLAACLLLTPLVGWVVWAWWREQRPRAAWQAFAFALPTTLAFTALVPALLLLR